MSDARPEGVERGDPDEGRWLLADADHRTQDAEVGERVEVERAAGTLVARIRSCVGQHISLRTSDGTSHDGLLTDVGDGWVLLEMTGRTRLVTLAETVYVVASRTVSSDRSHQVVRGPGWVYRRWARLRAPVTVLLRDGSRWHGAVVEVLRDAVTVRPEAGGGREVTLPFAAVVWVVAEQIPPE
jgi:hypothetical protein